MGSINMAEAEPEQVLIGEHNGMKVIVLSVKPDKDSAEACWNAACSIAEMFSGSPALIIDIANAHVRHGYITEISSEKEES